MADIGRPSDFTQELADKICAQLAVGDSMRTVCKPDDMPSMQAVFRWIRTIDSFREQYVRAKEEASDVFIEQMQDIADDKVGDSYLDDRGQLKTDWEVVGRSKLRIDTRKWIASKLKPKKYGDKMDLTTMGEKLPAPIAWGLSVNKDGKPE